MLVIHGTSLYGKVDQVKDSTQNSP